MKVIGKYAYTLVGYEGAREVHLDNTRRTLHGAKCRRAILQKKYPGRHYVLHVTLNF